MSMNNVLHIYQHKNIGRRLMYSTNLHSKLYFQIRCFGIEKKLAANQP